MRRQGIVSAALEKLLTKAGYAPRDLVELSASQLGVPPRLRSLYNRLVLGIYEAGNSAPLPLNSASTSTRAQQLILPGTTASVSSDMVSSSTRTAMSSGVKKYLSARANNNINPLPVSEASLESFASWLKINLPKSANAYLSHVRSHSEINLRPCYSQDLQTFAKRLRTSLARSAGSRESDEPLTISLLEQLALAAASPSEILILKMLAFCFFTILRIDEVRCCTRSRRDNGDICVTVSKSKTDQTGKGVSLCFMCCCSYGSWSAPGVAFCPVHALDDKNFKFAQAAPDTDARIAIDTMFEKIGISNNCSQRNRRLYNFHSSRIGGYQCALASGLDRELAKRMGRWSMQWNTCALYEGDAILSCLHTRVMPFWPLRCAAPNIRGGSSQGD